MGGDKLDIEKILQLQDQGMGKSKIASMIYGTKGAYKKKLDNFMQKDGYISIDGKYVKENADGIHLEYVKCNNGIQTDIKETSEEKAHVNHEATIEHTDGIQMEYTEKVEEKKDKKDNGIHLEYVEYKSEVHINDEEIYKEKVIEKDNKNTEHTYGIHMEYAEKTDEQSNKNDNGIHLEYTEHDQNNKENMPVEYQGNTNGVHQKEALDPVNNLSLDYKKRIDKMLEWFENKNNVEGEVAVTVTDVIEVGLKIDDKIKDGEFMKMSSYINKEIWDVFKDFMNEYKEVGNKYILSQAVKEYMDKYKK